ncbi:MAG: hypothetical protein JWL81_3247 [Verrucomicrobiales bacterium]|nr:hypothetical protein [Verrucomicrobiales bacterium]
MNPEPVTHRLFRMLLRRDSDVVSCRNRARMVAEKFGFQRQDQIRIATAVSEIARNAFRYAVEASAEFGHETVEKRPGKGITARLVCTIRDAGGGIPNLDEILSGKYHSKTGMGMGLSGAHRLMDHVEILTGPEGTTVKLSKDLPRGRTVTAKQLEEVAGEVAGSHEEDPGKEMASRNSEMLFMLEEIGVKSQELNKVNEELSETNRGVVALYDELDTIHRVGHVLASKLELDDLLQAIIDATTEICGADFGMFVYDEGSQDQPVRRHFAGVGAVAPELYPSAIPSGLVALEEGVPVNRRVDDLADDPGFAREVFGLQQFGSCLAIPVVSPGGRLDGAMLFAHRKPGTFTDRSERILSTVALQATIGMENAKLYKNVRSASAAKDEFLAILSHELRTPLNPIFTRLSLLEENPALPEDALEDIRLIRRNLELETRLIDDLLDMTRIARGKIAIKKTPEDLHRIIESAGHACSHFATQEGIGLELRLLADSCVVAGDSARLQQVFWNLLNNAIKFSPVGSRVVVSSENEGDCIRVSVKDAGRGINADRISVIFQPFEQDDAHDTGSMGGLGLGLAICKSIIEAHGGTIRAQSGGAGCGAMFEVTLRLTQEKIVSREVPAAGRPVASAGLRILLVDDHDDTRVSLKKLLERRGHQVETASTMRQAHELARPGVFQLLISDIGLPDASGHQLMQSLRGDPDLKAIAVSGYGMPADIGRSLESGFLMHLTKPLKIADLDNAIHGLFSPP